MSIINCFNCAVVNIPQKSSSRMPHKSCRTESCETGYNKSCLIFTLPMRYATFVNQSQSLIGYEPADLTVHPPPPPQNDRGWVHFFHIHVGV